MTEKDKLALIYRVTTGYTFIGDYIIDTPDERVLNESFNIYYKTIKSNRFEDFLHPDLIEAILIQYNLWTITSNADMEELDKSLDECKLSLFENFGMPEKEILKVRRQMKLIREQKTKLFNTKHMLDEYTLEGYAEHLTDLFIFSKVVLDSDYNRVNLPYCDLSILIKQYKKVLPTVEDLRYISRTDPWRSFWKGNNQQFRINGDTQKTLTLFTQMYDNVYENPDRPPDVIIEDNDMLDGWFIHMRKKAEAIQLEGVKEQGRQNLNRRYGNAGEVFKVVNAWEGKNQVVETTFGNKKKQFNLDSSSAEEVNNMNDARGHIVKQQIDHAVKRGTVKAFDIPELKQDAINRSKNGR